MQGYPVNLAKPQKIMKRTGVCIQIYTRGPLTGRGGGGRLATESGRYLVARGRRSVGLGGRRRGLGSAA